MNAEQHRRLQLALRATTLRQLLAIWPAFDIEDIDGSWPALQESLTSLIWLRNRDSATLSALFYRDARLLAGIRGSAPIVEPSPPALVQIDTSLTHVGPVGAKRLIALGGRTRADVSKLTLVKVAGVIGRLVLNGGRETITQTIQADRRARGYERVTSGAGCDFCEMLADRGAVYDEESADFEAHDHCSCSAVPIFD